MSTKSYHLMNTVNKMFCLTEADCCHTKSTQCLCFLMPQPVLLTYVSPPIVFSIDQLVYMHRKNQKNNCVYIGNNCFTIGEVPFSEKKNFVLYQLQFPRRAQMCLRLNQPVNHYHLCSL